MEILTENGFTEEEEEEILRIAREEEISLKDWLETGQMDSFGKL